MAESKDHLWKAQDEDPEPLEDLVKTGAHPLGLDVGTSKVVAARRDSRDVTCAYQLNAFIPVPYSPVTERTIAQQSEVGNRIESEQVGTGDPEEVADHVVRGPRGQQFGQAVEDVEGAARHLAGDAGNLVESIDDHVAPAAELLEHGARIEADPLPRLRVDATQLRQLLQNLIANAIKYTPAGRVLVGVRHAGPAARIEVIYTGLHQTPEMIAVAAVQEDVDAVGLSIMSGAHNTLFPVVMDALSERGANDILVFGGGIVPEGDVEALLEKGVGAIFTPGAQLEAAQG